MGCRGRALIRYNSAMGTCLKCVVRYDGTGFAGWQVQPGQRTVQGVLEDALSRIANRPVRIDGSGRTDSGVHALAQVFSCPRLDGVEPEKLRRALSNMLGPEVRVESVEEAAEGFHAAYSAVGKRYAYVVSQAREPDPFSERYAWYIPREVDREMIERLAQRLVGEHDFAGYCAGGSSAKTTVRTIHSIEVLSGGLVGPRDDDHLWRIEFHGGGFLYKMVRNITGTLVEVARGALPEERIDELLKSPGPFEGRTAPGQGLFLVEVLY